MSRIRSLEDLAQAKTQAQERRKSDAAKIRFQIRVSTASCGVAAGALDVLDTLQSLVQSRNLDGVCFTQMGCLGVCSLEPIVQVQEVDHPLVTYGKVSRGVASRIVHEHLESGAIVQEYVVELI